MAVLTKNVGIELEYSSETTLNSLCSDDGQQLKREFHSSVLDWRKDEPIARLLHKLECNERQRDTIYTYLSSLALDDFGPASSELSKTVEVGRILWQKLSSLLSNLDRCLVEPNVCPGDDGHIMYSWIKEELYLECEFWESGKVEFFYRNRDSGELWGEDTSIDEEFSAQAIEKLAHFSW